MGGSLQAVQYLNLNGAENGITYPVAQLVGASDAATRCCSYSARITYESLPLPVWRVPSTSCLYSQQQACVWSCNVGLVPECGAKGEPEP